MRTVIIYDDDPPEWVSATGVSEGSGVQAVGSKPAALETLSPSVDIVLIDDALLHEQGSDFIETVDDVCGGCQIGVIGVSADRADAIPTGVDAVTFEPVTADDVLELIDELEDRLALSNTVNRYLGLRTKLQTIDRLSTRSDSDRSVDRSRLESEAIGRRRQLETLLDRVDTGSESTESVDTASESTSLLRHHSHRMEFFALWSLALLTYGIGDTVTTVYAVYVVPALAEGNPVVDIALESGGLAAFLFLKAVIFLILLGISLHGAKLDDRLTYYWPPLVTIGLGVTLTAWNLRLILGA